MKRLSPPRRLSTVLSLLVLSSVLLVCSNDDGGVLDPGSTSGTTKTIPPAGGEITATSGGATITAEFPQGAVLENTRFTIRPAETLPGQRARFQIHPRGFQFNQPVTITVQLSGDAPVPDDLGMHIGSADQFMTLPATVDPIAHTITAEIFYWGDPTPTPVANARATADNHLPDTGFDDLWVARQDCRDKLDALEYRVLRAEQWFTSDGQRSGFFDITALVNDYLSFKLQCEAILESGDLDAWHDFEVQRMFQVACWAWENATTAAEMAPPAPNMEELRRSLGPLMAASEMMQMVGGGNGICAPTEDEVSQETQALAGKLFSDYLDQLELQASQPLGDARWAEILEDVRHTAIDINSAIQALGLDELETRLDDVICAQIQTARREAFEISMDDGNPFYLADLAWGVFNHGTPSLVLFQNAGLHLCLTVADLVTDIQYVGTNVTVQVYEGQNSVHSVTLGRGATAGLHTRTTSVTGNVDGGSLRFSGLVRALRCWDQANGNFTSQDGLVFRAEAGTQRVDLGTLAATNDVHLGTPFDVPVAYTTEQLGLPLEAGQQFDIVVTREGPMCAPQSSTAYGTSPYELLRVAVTTEGECPFLAAGRFDECDPLRQLTTDPGPDGFPRWSPDGSQIAFYSKLETYGRNIWLIPATGGTATNLTQGLLTHEADCAWSPDGSRIAFTYTNSTGPVANYDIGVASLAGGITRLTDPSNDHSPTWSPDGSQIAFVSNRGGNSDIWVMSGTLGVATNLTMDASLELGQATGPEWSPDGSQIAFVSDRSGNWDLWVIPSSGGAATNLTMYPGVDGAFSWSPDGSQIAFASDRSGNSDIWVMPSSGGAATNLTNYPGNDYLPWWSPDGSRIAFMSDRNRGGLLWVMPSSGGTALQVPESFASMGLPPFTWSPDGSRIAFESDRGGDRDIWVLRLPSTLALSRRASGSRP